MLTTGTGFAAQCPAVEGCGPVTRAGQPEKVAVPAADLDSDPASCRSGAVIPIDSAPTAALA